MFSTKLLHPNQEIEHEIATSPVGALKRSCDAHNRRRAKSLDLPRKYAFERRVSEEKFRSMKEHVKAMRKNDLMSNGEGEFSSSSSSFASSSSSSEESESSSDEDEEDERVEEDEDEVSLVRRRRKSRKSSNERERSKVSFETTSRDRSNLDH